MPAKVTVAVHVILTLDTYGNVTQISTDNQDINWVKEPHCVMSLMRGISCQCLPPGGSIVPRYVLYILFSEKSQNC
jgi:hypothetical protein